MSKTNSDKMKGSVVFALNLATLQILLENSMKVTITNTKQEKAPLLLTQIHHLSKHVPIPINSFPMAILTQGDHSK